MAQEIKNHQNNSNKIPFFNAIGTTTDTGYVGSSLPSFNNAANSIDSNYVHKLPEQHSNSSYHIRMQPDAHNAKPYQIKGEAVIDLTDSTNVQMTKNMNSNFRPQIQNNMIPPFYSTEHRSVNLNEQYMAQTNKTDPTQAKYSSTQNILQRKPLTEPIYLTHLTQNDRYKTSQQKVVTTATNTAQKMPSAIDYNNQYYTPHPHNHKFPPFNNASTQVPAVKYTRPVTRETYPGDIHIGDSPQKNNMYQHQTQRNPHQFNGYSKDILLKQQQQQQQHQQLFIHNSIQNTGLNGYSNTQQSLPVKQMEKNPDILKIHQETVGARSMVQHEGVMNSNYRPINNGMTTNSIQMESTQASRTAYKQVPMSYNKSYPNQILTTQDLQTMPKPMTTPRPTTMPEENTWAPVSQCYDFNNNNNNGIPDYNDGLDNLMEALFSDTDFLKFKQHLPEEEKRIQRIKSELLMTEVESGYQMSSNYGYPPREVQPVRKRHNEALSHPESSKKQTLLCKYPYYSSGVPDNSHNTASPPNYTDQSMYEMSFSSNQQSYQSSYKLQQSNYQVNSEMNHIVPTANSLHSSPGSNRNDSPEDPLLLKKKRNEEQDLNSDSW